jgi:DNA-binding NarL/FixJ family response regulator
LRRRTRFYDAGELIRKHRPDVLLIESFLEDRDGIRWIKDLATEFPRIRILTVSRQSERIYAARPARWRSRLLDEKRFGRRIIARC